MAAIQDLTAAVTANGVAVSAAITAGIGGGSGTATTPPSRPRWPCSPPRRHRSSPPPRACRAERYRR